MPVFAPLRDHDENKVYTLFFWVTSKAQVLYILSKGLVALDSRVGYNGAVWGEDFVLSDTSLIRPVAGYALTYIEVGVSESWGP